MTKTSILVAAEIWHHATYLNLSQLHALASTNSGIVNMLQCLKGSRQL